MVALRILQFDMGSCKIIIILTVHNPDGSLVVINILRISDAKNFPNAETCFSFVLYELSGRQGRDAWGGIGTCLQ